ncbi:3-alpha domain-containing protein [Flavobacterium sp. WV_118_3]
MPFYLCRSATRNWSVRRTAHYLYHKRNDRDGIETRRITGLE